MPTSRGFLDLPRQALTVNVTDGQHPCTLISRDMRLPVDYVRLAGQGNRQVTVLIHEVRPRRWRYRILQNQRGLLLATVLRASTDVVICTIPYRLTRR